MKISEYTNRMVEIYYGLKPNKYFAIGDVDVDEDLSVQKTTVDTPCVVKLLMKLTIMFRLTFALLLILELYINFSTFS